MWYAYERIIGKVEGGYHHGLFQGRLLYRYILGNTEKTTKNFSQDNQSLDHDLNGITPEYTSYILPFVFKDWRTNYSLDDLSRGSLEGDTALRWVTRLEMWMNEPTPPPPTHTHTHTHTSVEFLFTVLHYPAPTRVATEQLEELLNDLMLYTEYVDRHRAASSFNLYSVMPQRDCNSRTDLSTAGDVLEWRTLRQTSEDARAEVVIATETTSWYKKCLLCRKMFL
jgi:hypothetical protein